MQLFVPQMNCVVSLTPKPLDYLRADPHVRKKPHGVLRWVDFFRRQPRCIFERLANVLFFEIRVIIEYLVDRCSVRDLPDNHRDGDPHAADASASAHDVRIERDALEHDDEF